MSGFYRLKECLSNATGLRSILDYCAALGFKVVGGRRNEEGKQVAVISDVLPSSVAENQMKLMVGE